jgi:hypothetical protein
MLLGGWAKDMRRFVSIILVSLIVVSSLCVLAILFGQRQAEEVFISELHYCGSSVCFLGIVPGTTSWDKTLSSIHQAPQLETLETNLLFSHDEQNYVLGFVVGTREGIETPLEININLPTMGMDVGTLIARFGSPCYVVSFSGGGITLGYPNAIFYLSLNANKLSPFSHIDHIRLRPDKLDYCPTSWPDDFPSAIYSWRGFTAYPQKN